MNMTLFKTILVFAETTKADIKLRSKALLN